MQPSHLLLVDQSVPEWKKIYTNSDTGTLPYSTASTRDYIIKQIEWYGVSTWKRVAIFFSTAGCGYEKLFLQSQSFFHPDNVAFLCHLIKTYNVQYLDILGCKTGIYPEWQRFYASFISLFPSLNIGYANGFTGNQKTITGEPMPCWFLDSLQEDVESVYFDAEKLRNSWFHVLDSPPRYLTFKMQYYWEPDSIPVDSSGNYMYTEVTLDINNTQACDFFPPVKDNATLEDRFVTPFTVINLPTWIYKVGMYILANNKLYVYNESQLVGMYYSTQYGNIDSPTSIPVNWIGPPVPDNIVGQSPTSQTVKGLWGDMYSEGADNIINNTVDWIDGIHFFFRSPTNASLLDVEGYFKTQELVRVFGELDSIHRFSNVATLSNFYYYDAPYKINLLYWYTFEETTINPSENKVENCDTLQFDAIVSDTNKNIKNTSPICGSQYLHIENYDTSKTKYMFITDNVFTPTQNGWTFAMWFRLLAIPDTDATVISFSTTDSQNLYVTAHTQNLFWGSSNTPLPSKPSRVNPRKLNMFFLPLNTWVHLAMSFDNNTQLLKTYKNGSLEYICTQTPFPVGIPITIQGIGGYGNNIGNTTIIHADYDEIRVYDAVMTPEDIYSLAYYNLVSHPLLSVPYPPRNPHASHPTTTSIELTWDTPLYATTEDLRNMTYTVVAVPGNASQSTIDNSLIYKGISEPSLTMTNLSSTQYYTFRIFAINKVGSSLPSVLSNQVSTLINNIGGFDLPFSLTTGNGILQPGPMTMPLFSNNSAVHYVPNTMSTGVNTVANNRAKRLRC